MTLAAQLIAVSPGRLFIRLQVQRARPFQVGGRQRANLNRGVIGMAGEQTQLPLHLLQLPVQGFCLAQSRHPILLRLIHVGLSNHTLRQLALQLRRLHLQDRRFPWLCEHALRGRQGAV